MPFTDKYGLKTGFAALGLASMLMVISPVASQSQAKWDAVRTLVNDAIDDNEPGVAVGAVIDGEVVFTHYRGLANLDQQAPINAQSRFNIASNAKQFTALMILDLAHTGQINLADDFRKYLPDTMPTVSQKITIDQLLTHTSGIRDIYDLWALTGVTWYERPFRNRDAMNLLNRQADLNFDAGGQYLYSNSNYILLAELIAKVTGKPFHEYAQEFFQQRGMTNTQVRRRYGSVVPNRARAYGKWSGWLEDPAIANLFGDGFLFSTLADQLSWEAQVWGNQPTLPADLVAQSQRPIDGVSSRNYGYGLEFGRYRGLATVFHVGSTGGYNAYLLRFPTLRTSIVVLGNTTQVGVVGLGRAIAEQVVGDQFVTEHSFPTGPTTVEDAGPAADYAGLYELDSGTFVRIVVRQDGIYREIEGRDPVRLLPDGEGILAYESDRQLKVAFSRGTKGQQEFTIFAPFQAPQVATAVTEAPADESYRQSIEGTFVNAETDTVITLRYREANAFELIKNGRSRNATLVGQDYLAWNAYRLRIQRDDTGVANGLLVDNRRIKNVVFDRRIPEAR